MSDKYLEYPISFMLPEQAEALAGVELVGRPCLCCGQLYYFSLDTMEANGVFNVFCQDSDCEDEYAARQ